MKSLLYWFGQSLFGNPINLPTARFEATFPAVAQAVFGISFLLSIIFVALGGLKYATSNGDPQGIEKAKNTIIYALVGMAVSMSAYVLVGLVVSWL